MIARETIPCHARELPAREPWFPLKALSPSPSFRPPRQPAASEYVKACCPSHGWYLTARWAMPVPRGVPAQSLVLGCPVCIRQHAGHRLGGPTPDLPEVHRLASPTQGSSRV